MLILIIYMDAELCEKCKGKGLCGKACPILAKFQFLGKPKTQFSGSSPPEIFVGRYGYPSINAGILAPQEYGDTDNYSNPESWHENNFSIANILRLRSRLIYGRFKTNIKTMDNRLTSIVQEISMADKPVSTEMILKKIPSSDLNIEKSTAIIGNPAPLKSARLEENPSIPKKIDYLTTDKDVKAAQAIQELYSSQIRISNIIKVLSAGLLGKNRKMVPTRWAITATDDTLSKHLLEEIRFFPEISEVLVFSSEYLGNHYEFLLLPDKFSFEVIEAKMSGSVWNPSGELFLAKDYEGFSGRKNYADDVTGAYYVNRLALCEYLIKIQRQASCLVMRECRPEYYAPMGVGILREASRQAFRNPPESFLSISEALDSCQKRMRLPVSLFKDKSWLINNYGKQTRLADFS